MNAKLLIWLKVNIQLMVGRRNCPNKCWQDSAILRPVIGCKSILWRDFSDDKYAILENCDVVRIYASHPQVSLTIY